MTDHERIGRTESVEVDGRTYSGIVYHVRRNGWACIEDPATHTAIASGPPPIRECFPDGAREGSRILARFARNRERIDALSAAA